MRLGGCGRLGAHDVNIRRGTIYGNPFVMRDEGERTRVVRAYATLLRTARAPHRIAAEYTPRLQVHEASERTSMERRLSGLSRLATRVRGGESIRLRCACHRGKAAPGLCHGDVIAQWIAAHV